MGKTIVHISEVNISAATGVGRVELYWKKAFENAGYTFLHIGPEEVGKIVHPSLFPSLALKYYKRLAINPSAIIAHEPAAGKFVNMGVPCFVESHGVERRFWDFKTIGKFKKVFSEGITLRNRILFPLWRLAACDRAMRKGTKLLLINSEDKDYVVEHYRRSEKDIMIFKNGTNSMTMQAKIQKKPFTILYNGSWLERKGIILLVEAATKLKVKGFDISYLLIGTGKQIGEVLEYWPPDLRNSVTVVPKFKPEDEASYLSMADIFVLPSFFEGQPLSLLQAMAAGICCITTDCCGQRDIIQHNLNGLLFTPGNDNEFAALIELCFLNPMIVEQIGNKAKHSTMSLSWDQVSDEVADYVIKNIETNHKVKLPN